MDALAHCEGRADDAAARPLPAGVPCYQCAYDLAGLSRRCVCPECGLGVAASWPVWDLRACHPACVDQVYGELLGVRAVLGCAVIGTGWGAMAGLSADAARALPPIWALVVLMACFSAAGCAACVPALVGLVLRLSRVGGPAAEASGPTRRPLVVAVRLAIALLPVAIVLGVAGIANRRLTVGAMLPASIVVLCLAMVPLAMAAWAYAHAIVRRAGGMAWGRWPMVLLAMPALGAGLVCIVALGAPRGFDATAGAVLVTLWVGLAIARQDAGRAAGVVETLGSKHA